jgi:glycosyltransferase involved in cell wall biosynthesis
MRIGLTASLYDGGKSGIGRYIQSLLEGFAAAPRDMEYVVFRPMEDRGPLPEAPHIRYVRLPRLTARPLPGIFWHHTRLRGRLRPLGLDVVHFLTSRRLTRSLACPTVVTVHDLAPLHVAEKFDRARMFYHNRVVPFLLRAQDRCIAVSEATAADLRRVGLPDERIHVIPQGVDHGRYFPRPGEEARELARRKFGVAGPYLLYVARLEHPGKNHVRLLRAFRRIADAHDSLRLVLAGTEWFGQEAIYRESRELGLEGRVHFTGYVGDDDLPFLYSGAEALVFPSLYEGFGLPLLEAMACGTPVVASNLSSLPEVLGDCGILVDPASEGDIARGIEAALADSRDGRLLVRRGLERVRSFTWERTARETQQVYRRLLDDRLRRGPASGAPAPGGT